MLAMNSVSIDMRLRMHAGLRHVQSPLFAEFFSRSSQTTRSCCETGVRTEKLFYVESTRNSSEVCSDDMECYI